MNASPDKTGLNASMIAHMPISVLMMVYSFYGLVLRGCEFPVDWIGPLAIFLPKSPRPETILDFRA
eukprot:9483276-Karenia_brevis.AAC.1